MRGNMMNKIKIAILSFCACLAASAYGVTTHDLTVGGTNGYPGFLGRPVYVLSSSIDLSTYENTVTEGDAVKLINIPAGTMVEGVTYKLSTATTNDVWISIGDSGSATRWVNSLHGTATVYATETLSTNRVLETSANYVKITASSNAFGHTGVIELKAIMLNIN